MLTTDALRDYGANMDEGLGRCMGNEALYLRLVGTIFDDKAFDRLQESIHAGDKKAAFEAAHSLKGVLGNLALTPLFEPVCEITELLRAGEDADYEDRLAKILAERDRLAALK